MRLVDEMKMKLVPRGEQVAQRQQIEAARRTQEIVGRHLRRPLRRKTSALIVSSPVDAATSDPEPH
jgi:Spy/CpxP family protein refolding chaperone